MITIIHGDDIQNSRLYFIEQKQKNQNSVSFEGETLTSSEITQTLEGGGLFSDEKFIFIDQLISKRKPGKELEDIFNIVEKNKTANIFLWEGKELSKKQLSFLKSAESKLFAYPNILFSFLDNIKPGNAKNTINSFHNLSKNVKEELILFMMIRQFRLLVSCHSELVEPKRNPEIVERISESQNENIDEAKRLAPWQKSKLQKQADYFSKKQLINLYKKLSEIDLGLKTGTLSLTLTQAIDFFLLEI